tara:strand:+ start:2290 stop:2466 length:177 start_codon:yes stop_codon:yes gene_type:complete
MSLLKNILIAGLFLSVFVAVSPAFAETVNRNNEVTVYEDVRSIQSKAGASTAYKADFK